MRASITTGLLSLLLLGLAAGMAQAASLDDYLQPRCGVDDKTRIAQILATYQGEIINRAAAYRVLPDAVQNTILLGYLGELHAPSARAIATQVMIDGSLNFRHAVMGGIGATPDWPGLRVIAMGTGDADEMVRDSAATILADLDYSQSALQTAEGEAVRQELIGTLASRVSTERVDRIRGTLQTALEKLRQLHLPATKAASHPSLNH